MKLLSWCKSKAHNQSVLEGSTAPFQALKTPVVLLCVGYPTAAQPTNSESIPSHTHPVRAEQAWVRQSLFPILLMQSLNAVLISGIDRQVCKGNQNRACLCYKTWWPSSQWILPWLQSCFSQDGNAERLNPLTHQHSKSTSLHSKETNIICFHQRECCLLTVHTQCLTSLLLNLHSSKQIVLKMTTTCTLWGLSKAIPSKLLNSFYLPGHYKSFNIYKAFWNCPWHKPSWLFASKLGTLTKQAVFSSALTTLLGITAMPHQHLSVCIQRKHWQHWMQYFSWSLMPLCSWPPAGPECLWGCQEAAGNNTTNHNSSVNQWINFLT